MPSSSAISIAVSTTASTLTRCFGPLDPTGSPSGSRQSSRSVRSGSPRPRDSVDMAVSLHSPYGVRPRSHTARRPLEAVPAPRPAAPRSAADDRDALRRQREAHGRPAGEEVRPLDFDPSVIGPVIDDEEESASPNGLDAPAARRSGRHVDPGIGEDPFDESPRGRRLGQRRHVPSTPLADRATGDRWPPVEGTAAESRECLGVLHANCLGPDPSPPVGAANSSIHTPSAALRGSPRYPPSRTRRCSSVIPEPNPTTSVPPRSANDAGLPTCRAG